MRSAVFVVGFAALILGVAGATISLAGEDKEGDLKPVVKIGAFVDTYYAYDFNRPGADRVLISPPGGAPALYATQPARHNEFNLNLAFIEARVVSDRVRGRLAFQAGNSVQTNYAADTMIDQARAGGTGAGGISRYIQEAVIGYEISPKFWIDAGIYFSHLGMESFISRDNWTYTRSLGAENSPYYQSGVRLSYEISNQLSAQLHLMNGWQNINETNSQKAVGTQIVFSPMRPLTLTYNTFIGHEAGARVLHDFIVKYALSDVFQLAAVFDIGMQKPTGNSEFNKWYVTTLLARYQIATKVALAARAEKFLDAQSSIVSAVPTGFNAVGGSLGVDVALRPELLWRNEVRFFSAAAEIFPEHDGRSNKDGFAVTSLSLTL